MITTLDRLGLFTQKMLELSLVAGLELAQRWGTGLVASVDGMRFVMPVATVNAHRGIIGHLLGRRTVMGVQAVTDGLKVVGWLFG